MAWALRTRRVRQCRRATPILEAPRLAERLGATAEGGGLYVKDEGRLPTGSFKARGLVMAVSMAKEMGVKVGHPPSFPIPGCPEGKLETSVPLLSLGIAKQLILTSKWLL